MKLNCRPGDLAVIVNEEAGCEANIGKFVTVLDKELCDQGEWRVKSQSVILAFGIPGMPTPTPPGEEIWTPDAYLRPIRDPGDSAVDETLQRIPTPYLERA